MSISPASLQLLHSLALGFAFSGLLISAYRAITDQPASFRMLQAGGLSAVLAVPFLAFAAPAIIVRNTIRGRRIEKRRFEFVFLAGLIACFWSLFAGRVVTMVIASLGF